MFAKRVEMPMDCECAIAMGKGKGFVWYKNPGYSVLKLAVTLLLGAEQQRCSVLKLAVTLLQLSHRAAVATLNTV